MYIMAAIEYLVFTLMPSSTWWDRLGADNTGYIYLSSFYNVFCLSIEPLRASIARSGQHAVVFGSVIELSCFAVGPSPFNLSITVDGQVLARATGVVELVPLNYTLEIADDNDYATYTCLAESSLSTDASRSNTTIVRARELLFHLQDSKSMHIYSIIFCSNT